MSNIGESECIPGDLKFGGFEDIMVESTTCLNDSGKQNVAATAKYAECECGKWVEKEETVYASGVKNTGDITYKWTFTKDGELRNINEIMTRKSKLDVCTTGVQVMVPKDLREKEPSTDNSQYVACPAEGIRIPSEQVIVLHGGYIPDNATNRVLEWTKDGNAFTMASTKNYVSKSLYSRAIVTVKKVEKGETASNIATATTTLKQAGTCKVNTWDGAMEKFWCNDLELNVGTSKVIESGYEPYNANKTEFEYSVSDTSVVNIEGNNLIPYKEGKVVLTIKDIYTGNSNTCNLTVKYNFTNLNVEYTNSENYSLYKVYDNKGEVVLTTNNYSDAKAKYDELDPGEPLYDDEKSTTPKITIPNGKFEKMLEWKGTMDNGDEFGCNSYGGGCTNITEVREAEAAAAARVNGSGSGWVDVNYTGWSQSSGYSVVTSLPLICAHPCI